MNKTKILLGFFLLLCIDTTAQNIAGITDSLLLADLTMTKYDKDTSAEAVVLSDIGTVSIAEDESDRTFKRYFTKTLTIKILSQAGLSYGFYGIPLYNGKNNDDDLTKIEAATYNIENGKIISTLLNKKQIYEEITSPQIKVKRIAMPDVKVGSVICISYSIKSSNIGYFNWDFQEKIPVIYSNFSLCMPPFCDYMSLQKNVDTTAWIVKTRQDYTKHTYSTEEYQNVIYSYTYKDVPAFKDETFISSPEDYLIQVGFQLAKWQPIAIGTPNETFLNTWKEFTDKLLDIPEFGEYLEAKRKNIEELVEQLNIAGKPQGEKVKTILNYVKTNYKWNNLFDFNADKKMSDFLTEKVGNSADINLFLTALLKAASINASPVVISTRNHGKVDIRYPFFRFFNDVICYVKTDSLSLLLDATEPLLPYYSIPPQCDNSYGYIVQKDEQNWVDIKAKTPAKTVKSMLIQISQNLDSINCGFTIKASGYSAYSYRKDWTEGYEKFSSMLTKGKSMEISDSIKVRSLNNLEEPFFIAYSASLPAIKDKTDTSGGYRIIFSPFLHESIQDNPLKMSDRKYPVDMNYPREYEYQATVVIPKGYKLYKKPDETNYSISNNDATFFYKISQISDDVIQFTSDLSFNIPVFQPSDYKELKNIYDTAIKKCKEPIVLEKK